MREPPKGQRAFRYNLRCRYSKEQADDHLCQPPHPFLSLGLIENSRHATIGSITNARAMGQSISQGSPHLRSSSPASLASTLRTKRRAPFPCGEQSAFRAIRNCPPHLPARRKRCHPSRRHSDKERESSRARPVQREPIHHLRRLRVRWPIGRCPRTRFRSGGIMQPAPAGIANP